MKEAHNLAHIGSSPANPTAIPNPQPVSIAGTVATSGALGSRVDGSSVAVGSTTDVEVTGNGSVIAILKRQRTLLGTIITLLAAGLPAALVAGRLDVNVGAIGVALPIGFNHLGRTAVDSILANQTHIGRVTVDSSIASMAHIGRVTVDSSIASMAHVGRVSVDSILANYAHIGRTAIDSILANQTHIGRVAVDSDLSTFASVSLGTTSNGKTNVLKTGSLTTTAATADQVVLTYTVTNGKTFYLQYLTCESRLTTLSATASVLGVISLETPSGTKVISHSLVNGTGELNDDCDPYYFAEPIPIASAVVIRCVTTPTAVTSMLWICNFGGYEK